MLSSYAYLVLTCRPCSRPSMSTAKFSAFSPSSEFSDDKLIAPPAYLPRSHGSAYDPEKSAPSPTYPALASPARSETRTHITSRTSLSDTELDDLLARCPSISTGVPSPNSPLEFGHRLERTTDAERSVLDLLRAPSPAYSGRPVSSPSCYSHRSSSIMATCAGSVSPQALSCGYEHYTV